MPTTVKYQTGTLESGFQSRSGTTIMDRLRDMTRDPDLLAIILFTVVGLIITFCLVKFLPLSAEAAVYLAQTTS